MARKWKEKETERKKESAKSITKLIKPPKEMLTASEDALPNVDV